MYDIKTVPKFNINTDKKNSVEIIDSSGTFILYNNKQKWMTYNPSDNQSIKELYSMYDQAYGNVLISGLGFGIVLTWIASKPEVKSITCIDISQDVIDLFLNLNKIDDKITIINADASRYSTQIHYNCIFLDHYEEQELDWILEDMKKFTERVSHDVFWAWPLEQAYMLKMYGLGFSNGMGILKEIKKSFNYSKKWNEFVKTYFPNNKHLKSISKEKVDEYINVSFK
jgi:hypothetical protein